jgi:pimeloyl-ACP methyl ester carboxylesterase
MLLPRLERTVTLHDGRALGYAEFGDPRGVPTFFFHGLPSTRLSAAMIDAGASANGVRLIAPDRPGVGLSDEDPERTFLSWAEDVEELADAIGLTRYALMGVSGALPYVCACLIRHPQRVLGAAIVSGLGPLDVPGVLDGMNRETRTLYRMAMKSPRLGRVWMRMFATAAKTSPNLVYRQQMSYLPEVDQAYFESEEMRELRQRDLEEAFRRGSGAASLEAQLHVTDWGFELADVAAPVLLWVGEEDRHHPLKMGRYLATALPACVPIFVPGVGAFGFIDRMDEIVSNMLALAPRPDANPLAEASA